MSETTIISLLDAIIASAIDNEMIVRTFTLNQETYQKFSEEMTSKLPEGTVAKFEFYQEAKITCVSGPVAIQVYQESTIETKG